MIRLIYKALRIITWIILVFLVLMTLSKLLPRVYDFFSGIIEAIRSLVSSTGHSASRLADDFGLLR